MADVETKPARLQVANMRPEDGGRGLARLPRGLMNELALSEGDVVEKIKEMTGGYGADVYLEGTGHPSAVLQGLNCLRKLGRFVEYSVFKDDVSVDWSIISDDKELDVLGAHLGPHTWPGAIKMLDSGILPMDRIASHQLPLSRFQEGLDLVADGKTSVKVSLIPDALHAG